MGTTSSDSLYDQLLHGELSANQRRSITLTEHRIRARWQEWIPAFTQLAREQPHPEQWLEKWKTIHHERALTALNLQVLWPSIRRHRLDDPLMPIDAFTKKLREIRDRSARHANDNKKEKQNG